MIVLDPQLASQGLTCLAVQALGPLRWVAVGRTRPERALRLLPFRALCDGADDAFSREDPDAVWLALHGLYAGAEGDGQRVVYGASLHPARSGTPNGRALSVTTATLDLRAFTREPGYGFAPRRVVAEGMVFAALGLSPVEWPGLVTPPRAAGHSVARLDAALRSFERVEGQCGCFVYLGDTLVMALVLPNEEDWARVHRAAVLGLAADAVGRAGALASVDSGLGFRADLEGLVVNSLARLKLAVDQHRARLSAVSLSGPLLGAPFARQTTRSEGPFALCRVLTPLGRNGVEHVAEVVVRRDAPTQPLMLSLHHLGRSEVARGYLLRQLVDAGFSVAALSRSLRRDPALVKQWCARLGLTAVTLEGRRAAAPGPKRRRT
ncbi:MAG: hypothetical protein JNK72_10955 [Myxococcales bacterium]|nr:hypothetical protein [Myxococcales bacterium]